MPSQWLSLLDLMRLHASISTFWVDCPTKGFHFVACILRKEPASELNVMHRSRQTCSVSNWPPNVFSSGVTTLPFPRYFCNEQTLDCESLFVRFPSIPQVCDLSTDSDCSGMSRAFCFQFVWALVVNIDEATKASMTLFIKRDKTKPTRKQVQSRRILGKSSSWI